MASYDVAVWLRSENVWPEMVVVVHAETPLEAAWKVLHTRGVRRAVKLAASCGEGTIQRWHGVITLRNGLAYDQMTCSRWEVWRASKALHRQGRMKSMQQARFTIEHLGRYTAEHDRVDNSLRLCCSGEQLFMHEDEARALLTFLQQLYPFEDTARYETDYGYLEETDAAWHV